jgi:hypothetical protein
MKKIYVKISTITNSNFLYLINYGICNQHKKTLSFLPQHYHAYKISGYIK